MNHDAHRRLRAPMARQMARNPPNQPLRIMEAHIDNHYYYYDYDRLSTLGEGFVAGGPRMFRGFINHAELSIAHEYITLCFPWCMIPVCNTGS